jgi:hypothetical protein
MRGRLPVAAALVAALAAGAILFSWQGGLGAAPNQSRPALTAMPACADADITFRLTTNSPVYLPGQPVRVSLDVRNSGSRWCKVIGQCDEVATLAVFDSGRLLWSDRPCLNHEWDAVPIGLAPGRVITSGGAWPATGARPGWYEARAAFLKAPFLVL